MEHGKSPFKKGYHAVRPRKARNSEERQTAAVAPGTIRRTVTTGQDAYAARRSSFCGRRPPSQKK